MRIAGWGAVAARGPQKFRVDACAPGSGEVHVETFGEGGLEIGGHEFHVGVDRGQLGKGGIPIVFKVMRARVDTLVGGEFFLGQVK